MRPRREALKTGATSGSQGDVDDRFARREFLRFVAGSPLLLSSVPAAAAERLLTAVASEAEPIMSAADAINVFDFESAAERKLLSAHFTYLSMGVQDEFTLRANREAFGQIQLRPVG